MNDQPKSLFGISNEVIVLLVILLIGGCLFAGLLAGFKLLGGSHAAPNPAPAEAGGQGNNSLVNLFASPAPSLAIASITATYSPAPTMTVTPFPNVTRNPKYTQIVAPSFTPMPSLTRYVPPNTATPQKPKATAPPKVTKPTKTLVWPTFPPERPPVDPCPAIPDGLAPSNDTWIDSAGPDTAHPSDAALFVKTTGSGSRHILLRFELSSVSSASNALLYLQVKGSPHSAILSLYQVTSDWNETTATWNNGLGGPWTAAGGDYNGAPVTSFNPVDSCSVSADITSLVQSWLGTPASNFGLILVAEGPDSAQNAFFSKEKLSNPPSLVITP